MSASSSADGVASPVAFSLLNRLFGKGNEVSISIDPQGLIPPPAPSLPPVQANSPQDGQEVSRLREMTRSLTIRLRSVSAERDGLMTNVTVLTGQAKGLQGELTAVTGHHNEAIIARDECQAQRDEYIAKHDRVLVSLGVLKRGQLKRAQTHADKIMQIFTYLRTHGVSRDADSVWREAMRVRPDFGGWPLPTDLYDPIYPMYLSMYLTLDAIMGNVPRAEY